ncbi:MAG TPA: hypothetical protein VH041_15540 [Caldimonas sp.]|nr:hypothetical protein [Caldimonas sp.]HEX4235706.1 hypothetical protein [Caldimonas sp.]
MTADQPRTSLGAHELIEARALPFRISIATSQQDLIDVVSLRSQAYARHNAPAAGRLKSLEEQDRGADAIVLLARSKLDAMAVGSVRVQTRVSKPLMVEGAMQLPYEVANANPVELMRGSISNGTAGRMVSASLAKASFLLCLYFDFSHVIVTCREPVNLMYRAYQFDELLSGEMIDLPYSPGVKHKVLCLPMKDAVERWRSRNRPLFDFMLSTNHPDIQLDHAHAKRQLDRAAAMKLQSVET